MADLITTIKVNSNQFDNSIKESTNQIRKFKSEGDKAGKGVSDFGRKLNGAALGGVAKLAGGIGAAITVTQAFEGVIQSTQNTADAFDIKMQQVKSSVDYFFTSIATGDWSNFWSGLEGAIERGRKLAETMDYLGDIQAGYSDKEFDIKTKIDDNNAIIYDNDASKESKQKAYQENQELIAELSRVTNDRVIPAYKDAIIAAFENSAQMGNLTESDVDKYMDIMLKDNEQYKDYVNRRNDLLEQSKETVSTVASGNYGVTVMSTKTQSAQLAGEELELFKRQNAEMEKLYNIENNITDTEKQNLVVLRQQYKQTQRNISQLEKQQSRYAKRVNVDPKGKAEEIFPEGSIAELEKRIANLNKQIKLETDPVAYKALNEEIKMLQKEVVYIKVMYTTDFNANERIGNSIPNVGTPKAATGAFNFEQMSEWGKNVVEQNKEVELSYVGIGNSIGYISSAFGVMGSLSSEAGQSAMGMASSVLGSIGMMIPAIKGLTLMNNKAALSEAVKSGSALPFPANIFAIGSGVAAVIAALATPIPQFAEGGLVYGNTIAQVGEYAGASNNPEVIAPLSKLRKILADTNGGGSGSVDFRIAGKDLVGVINNYSSKNNKK